MLLVHRYFRISILLEALICLFFLVSPGSTFAIDSPQQYFDYNAYYEPKVLGVFAQDSSASGQTGAPNYKDYKEFAYLLAFTKDMTPDNPLYFLKRMEENVALVFATGNAVKRADTLLAIGGERTAEIDEMATAGKTGAIGALVASYDRTMADQANTLESLKGTPVATPLLLETDKEVAKHMLTLEEVSLKVPEAAAAHINTALTKAEEVVDRVADAAGRPAVPQEMIARLQAYKAQGLLSEEEITNIVSSGSRQQARSEFRKLADSRIVPLADVKKFDEAAASYYPEGFARAVELRKFKELERLERDRPDEVTVQAIQDFAKTYKAGEVVPPAIRSWWAPMLRLEELQATFRPDLLDAAAYFKYRPEEQQKYTELVERMKPTEKDMQYVQDVVRTNPSAVNDPAYARVLQIGERFGTADSGGANSPVAQSCSRESHWVNVPFMPGGGYCVPDLVYQSLSQGAVGGDTPCPPNYRRLATGGSCYPDNPSGPGVTQYLPASGSCPSGYRWQTNPAGGRGGTSNVPAAFDRGGYCSPDYVTGSGGYPSPITPPSYCPQGKMFREGKCEDYNPPPAQGCGTNSWWNGQKCIEQKNCGEGKYQDSNGECKSSADEYKKYQSLCQNRPIPPGGCGSGYWDMASCSCVGGGGGDTASMKSACERGGCRWTGVGNACECPSGGGSSIGTPSREDQEATCRAGGGRCVSWVNGACGCERSSSGGGGGGGSSAGGCPAGTAWNGSYCMQNIGGTPAGGGGYTMPGSYSPEEMCRRTPNCSWNNGACGCSSSGGTGGGTTSGGSSGSSGPPSCGSGYYWNGSACTRSESQTQSTSPAPSSNTPAPTSAPPPSAPPPSTESQPSSPPPPSNPPPAENPPPAPPPESAPPPPSQ